jgi:PAS domain S-box-containing protein
MAVNPSNRPTESSARDLPLIHSLNAAAASIQSSVTSKEHVFLAFKKEVIKLGLRGGIGILKPGGKELVFACVAYPKGPSQEGLRDIAAKLGILFEGYAVSYDRVDIYREIIEKGRTIFVGNSSAIIKQILPSAGLPFLSKLITLISSTPGIYAPLVSSGIVRGLISIQGKYLHEGNAEEITAFANHLAVALENATLWDDFRKSETLNRNILESSPMGTHQYELKPDGRLVFTGANLAADKILGVDNSAFIGKTIEEAFPHLVTTEIPVRYREVAKTGISWQTEQIDYHDAKIQGAFHVVAFRTAENCMTAMFLDLTESKRTELALAERNKFVESLVNITPDILYIYDLVDKIIVYSNNGIQRILGYSVKELQDMGSQFIPNLMHPDDLPSYLQITIPKYAATRDHESIIHQYRMKHKTGEWRWLFSNEIIYLRQPDGSPRQLFGVAHDITELKRTELELSEAVSIFRSIFEQSPVGTVFVGLDKRFIRCNSAFCRFLGYTENELIGKHILDATYPEDAELGMKQMTQIAEGKLESFTLQKRYLQKDGEIVWGEISISLVRDINNKPLYFLPVIKDITDRKKSEEIHRKYEEQLQRNQRLESLGVLAGGIAHDFNNLLAGIFGHIDLARVVSKDAQVKQYLEAMFPVMDRAKALTQQLLTFAKGGFPVKKIASLIPFLQETSKFAFSGSNISCQFSLAENLWPCNIDKDQIGQVIDNIIINAQQAMPNGGTIEISATNISLGEINHLSLAKGNYVKISIKDFGIGIPKEILPRIFDPFYTTKTKGHGLGLTTSYSIINRHGGCIDVESEPDNGSTFYIYLPASSETIAANAATARMHKGSGTIIVMDDVEVVRKSLQKILQTMGYTVFCTKDGREAIDFYIAETKTKRQFAAMIFDLTVPGGMGGMEAVTVIRELNKEIPVFVASGYAENSVMKNPVEYGFTASISKPFNIEELSEMLNTFLKVYCAT